MGVSIILPARLVRIWYLVLSLTVYLWVAAVPLIVIGLYWGINFLSIKLTLYYIPLYLCGYLFGQIQLKYDMSQKLRTIQVVASFAVGLWIYIITRLDFYGQEVSITILFARYLAAIAGCCVIIYWASGLLSGNHPVDSDDNDYKKSPFLMKNTFLSENLKSQLFCILKQSGFNSISLYLIHGFFLNIIPIDRFYNVELIAIPLCFINYLICVTLTLSLIKFLKKFPHLNYLLLWNRTI